MQPSADTWNEWVTLPMKVSQPVNSLMRITDNARTRNRACRSGRSHSHLDRGSGSKGPMAARALRRSKIQASYRLMPEQPGQSFQHPRVRTGLQATAQAHAA